ncbi:MAG: 16S rRNA (guanine(966)-N(2))-methyltransferase RsmD [Bacilli bacterium]|nr:16S rRNA (guanine(966)-N(2))-methyltransferase RsmD [Bacilli bacterium]
MRVISGKYKGKKLKGFNIEGTRPTMDRVKESLFGIIQSKVPASKCLDLFAGTGALGIEALSNGATSCDFVDCNKMSIDIIKENTKNIKEKLNIINMDYKKFLKTTNKKYDIIFLDPPYKNNLLNKAIKYIEENNLLNDNGIIVCEYEVDEIITNLKEIKAKNYGSKKIKIFEK